MNNTIISILAGLGGMFGWGTSDFLANSASEKVGHFKTFFYSQLAGLAAVAVIIVFTSANFTFSPLLILAIVVSGTAYAFGYLLFYKGFEIGNVSVVSSVINLQNVFIVAIAYFLYGQRITPVQIPALILLLIGVTLVSVNFADFKQGRVSLLKGAKESFLAALMFGIFFWPVNQFIVRQSDWLATNLLTKIVAIVVVYLIAKFSKKDLSGVAKSSINIKFLIVAVGLLEAVGVLSVSGGLSVGNAIIINPVASALTVVTVGMAMVFLKEKISKNQAIGIVLTVIGIVMMSLG